MLFDIVFQSGEFYGESSNTLEFIFQVISESIGAFIGAGAAIWLFYKQNKQDKTNEAASKIGKAQDDINYISFLIEDVVTDQETQNVKLDTYLSESRANRVHFTFSLE